MNEIRHIESTYVRHFPHGHGFLVPEVVTALMEREVAEDMYRKMRENKVIAIESIRFTRDTYFSGGDIEARVVGRVSVECYDSSLDF